MKIRVILINTWPLFSREVTELLETDPHIEFLGTFTGEDDSLEHPREAQPDVVILNVAAASPQSDPLNTIVMTRKLYPSTEFVVMLIPEYTRLVKSLIDDLGVRGCLFMSDKETLSLAQVVRQVYQKEHIYSHSIMNHYFKQNHSTLTVQELSVMRLSCQGVKPKKIAEKMGLAPSTIRNIRHTAYQKLDISLEDGVPIILACTQLKTMGLL